MRRTALALITASILSFAACGGDDSTPGTAGGGGGTGGTAGSGGGKGGGSGTGGSSGTGGASGTGGTSGSGGSAGTGGAGGAGQAGKAGGDASTGTDVRPDTPTGTPDATTDATTDGSTPADAADGPPGDTSSPPDGGTSDTAPPTDGSAGDVRSDAPSDGTSTMVLTSSAFTEGMTIPAAHTCETTTNVSPPLAWTAGPSGTLSYAIVFTDKNNGLVHSGIYDIPPGVMSLPMNVEKAAMPSNVPGAKQVLAYSNMPGYAGPCPGPSEHTYEFMLYAVDVAALPGIATTQKGAALVTALQAHDIVTTTLTGKAKTP